MAVQVIDECVDFLQSCNKEISPERGPPSCFVINSKLDEMIATAKKIATRGKGILAADESPPTIGKRLTSININNTAENRSRYREIFITSNGIENYISGIILHEETLYQSTCDNKLFVDILSSLGIVIGIKVDRRTRPLPYHPNETYTQGLTDLNNRCAEYYKLGARFAKWRAVLRIQNGYISETAIRDNAYILARYASICQSNGLVPIIEPEILMDGKHSLVINQYWTQKVLSACYKALNDNNIVLEATLLKPNMCLSGKQYTGKKNTYNENAIATINTLMRSVPPAVPGIMFLSGGQSEEDATLNLNNMNKLFKNLPWTVSFSFGRSLQQSAMKAWNGNDKNVKRAQVEFITRAKANSQAQLGNYRGDAVGSNSMSSLFVDDKIRH